MQRTLQTEGHRTVLQSTACICLVQSRDSLRINGMFQFAKYGRKCNKDCHELRGCYTESKRLAYFVSAKHDVTTGYEFVSSRCEL